MNNRSKKYPWLAILWGILFIGLGHVYGGRTKRGVFSFFGAIFLLSSIRLFASSFYILVFILLFFILFYLFILIDSFLFIKWNQPKTRGKYDKWYSYLGFIILINFSLSQILPSKIFINTPYQLFTIPTPSMSPALLVGDYITASKGEVESNSIVVFNPPTDSLTFYVKRAVGLPGETIQLKDQRVYKAGKIDDTPLIKRAYLVNLPNKKQKAAIYKILDSANVQFYYDTVINVFATSIEYHQLQKIPQLTIYKRPEFNYPYPTPHSFLNALYLQGWTSADFGPLYVPKRNETIQSTLINSHLYDDIIIQENKNAYVIDKILYVNSQPINNYTFKNDYYFMMGDNRMNALDSRFWGFVSKRFVYGKVLYIYYSKHTERINTVL